MSNTRTYDLIIIGSGPAGLEMALAAAEAELDFLVLERGEVADNIRSWGWVNLFTPWKMNVSAAGLNTLGLKVSDSESAPSAAKFRALYLEPIAGSDKISKRLRLNTEVIAVGRHGEYKSTKIGDSARAETPFVVLARTGAADERHEETLLSRNVVDASGVYGVHRWLGSGGIPAPGEREHSGAIRYTLEDISADPARFDNKVVTIVGAGYSACTMLEAFKHLRDNGSNVKVLWVTSGDSNSPIDVDDTDPLPYRKRLGEFANNLAKGSDSFLKFLNATQVIETAAGKGDRVRLLLENKLNGEVSEVQSDVVYAMVGYKPDRSLYEELQVHECWATSGPMKLAATLLSQAGGDCLSIDAGGPETLLNPEPGFYVIGAKSYGRNSQFLLQRLEEQIPAVINHITSALRSSPAGISRQKSA